MAETLNLIQKLAKIRAISDVVAKEKRGYNYSYADITKKDTYNRRWSK